MNPFYKIRIQFINHPSFIDYYHNYSNCLKCNEIHYSFVCALLYCQHGRLKVKTTAEQDEAKKKERQKKLQLYQAGMQKAMQKVSMQHIHCNSRPMIYS